MPVQRVEDENGIVTFEGSPPIMAESPRENLQIVGHQWVGYAFNLCFGETPGMIVYRGSNNEFNSRSDWIALPPSNVPGQFLSNGTGNQVVWADAPGGGGTNRHVAVFEFSGNGGDIQAGAVAFVHVPFMCTIESVVWLAAPGQSGDIEADVRVCAYGSWPATSGDSIVGTTPPAIVGDNKSKDSTLTGWAKVIPADSCLAVVITSCSGITQATLSLYMVE